MTAWGRGPVRSSGPKEHCRELGMGEPQIVELFGDMVGEFIAQRKAQPVRRAVRTDQIESDDLRLLAAILCEGG